MKKNNLILEPMFKASDYIKLVKNVFSSEEGKKLLSILVRQEASKPLFGPDAHSTSYLVGRHDVVQELQSYLDSSDSEMVELLKFERKQELEKERAESLAQDSYLND